MAEERNVGLARTSEDSPDVDPTKAELQRRMEEARESISQTVSEIKDTVVTQYQQVKETINDTLDWREQYKRHTLPFTLTAFAVGTFIGYTVMGAFKGGAEDDDYDTEDALDRIDRGFDEGMRSYAASPVIGKSSRGASAYQRSGRPESNAATEGAEVFGGGGHSQESASDVGPSPRPSYSSGYSAPTAQQARGLTSYADAPKPAAEEEQAEEEPKGPGLIERFKETKAYDRLTDELSTVGERVVEELSRTAQTVVVPLLLNKLKSLIGVDLSGQRGGARQSAVGSGSQSGGGQQQSQGSTSAGAQGTPSQTSTGSDASAGGTSARAAGVGGTEGYGAS